jgi:hypothetical protein
MTSRRQLALSHLLITTGAASEAVFGVGIQDEGVSAWQFAEALFFLIDHSLRVTSRVQ